MSTRVPAVLKIAIWARSTISDNVKRSVELLNYGKWALQEKQGRGIANVYLALLANRVSSAGKDWKKQMFTIHLF